MNEKIDIKLTKHPLNLQTCINFVQDESCGGIATFIGTVRNKTNEKTVKKLDFTCYNSMAKKEMYRIAEKALTEFNVFKIAIHHAEGSLQIGDVPVIIAVSSAHREASFLACKFAIDSLKKTVPIWKKEHFEDGEVWVNAHP